MTSDAGACCAKDDHQTGQPKLTKRRETAELKKSWRVAPKRAHIRKNRKFSSSGTRNEYSRFHGADVKQRRLLAFTSGKVSFLAGQFPPVERGHQETPPRLIVGTYRIQCVTDPHALQINVFHLKRCTLSKNGTQPTPSAICPKQSTMTCTRTRHDGTHDIR